MGTEFEAGAEATKEVARTAGKAIDASSGLGRFLARIFGPALEEYGGQMHDTARFRRAANLMKLQQRWEQLWIDNGASNGVRPLPFKFAQALLDAASVEEEEELQDLFAKLLFNATDTTSQAETRQAFVSMLHEMNGFDVKVLFALAKAPDAKPRLSPKRTVYTAKLPDAYIENSEDPDNRLQEPPGPVLVSLNNLARLGCVVPAGVWDGAISFGLVTFTPLGQALVAACSIDADRCSSQEKRNKADNEEGPIDLVIYPD
ncbi:DUF4393 domain-containing protein [Methylobacterium sp. C25]|uniref:Abi-alpha family protein n=1 Tax=Methylobacterium sp. C25 TaxID=2721622 RepID=UPI001F250BDB|nr:Abi-alpha family protein [Methylobacterium sp. C25]MCE4224920.1 DUF4393 domain-containing protein [Methylobacterium sp. C25]